MDKADNKRAIIVGVFLALGLIIFVFGVLTLGGNQKTFVKSIHITAVFDDVQGLKKGNNVWFSGVNIGTISDVSFSGPEQVKVLMKIAASNQPYIHRNANARISSDGLIGNKIIVIDGGSPQAPIVQDGDVLQAAKLPSTDDMMKTLQQNNQNLLSITGDIKLLSRKILQGKGTVGALMADSLMGIQLRAAMANLAATTASAARTSAQLEAFGKKVNTKGGLADNLFTDTATFNKIKASANQLQKSANNFQELTNNLNRAGKKFNSTDNTFGYLLNDPKGAQQIQTILENLRQSAINLNEDTKAAQNNFLLKGYFTKKEKAKADSIKKANKK